MKQYATPESKAEVSTENTASVRPPPQPVKAVVPSRWVPIAALGIALAALALAGWSVLRPSTADTAASAATGQQVADAKDRACSASNLVSTAVSLQTHIDPGTEPAAVQAVAANARLSMAAGGSYLLAHLDPATPAPLAAEIRSFANNLQDIVLHTMSGMGNDDPAQMNRLQDGQETVARITEQCK
jgi:hypothetical protein